MARPCGTWDKKGRYTKGSIYAAFMAQLQDWQALEDGIQIVQKPKKKKKKVKSKKYKPKDAVKKSDPESTDSVDANQPEIAAKQNKSK